MAQMGILDLLFIGFILGMISGIIIVAAIEFSK